MAKYISFNIEALEDLKLAQTNVQIDSEDTLEYIPGSSIRGAFIYKYIEKYGVEDINQGIHREKLLKGGIKFLNAYPEYDDERSIPLPKIYFSTKESMRLFDMEEDALELTEGLDNLLPLDYERVRKPEFAGYKDDALHKIDVEKISNLHINKSKEKNSLFRYEAIKRNQIFKGIIKVENESYINEIKEIFEDAEIYIGGSKGSGYGRCKITSMEELEENPEYEPFKERDCFEKNIYILALSDIIYRNDLGQYKTKFEEEYLCKELGLKKIEYVDSIIDIKNITSYNNKWNCRTPQIIGIKGGSVFKYKIVDGEINKDKLMEFMDKGIGERRADGFGRFVILDSLNEYFYLNCGEGTVERTRLSELYNKLEDSEKLLLKGILTDIYKKNIEEHIGHIVLEKSKYIKYVESMNRNQWGNFKDLFSYLATLEPKEGIKKYNDYISNIVKKGSTSYKQIRRVKYGNGDIQKLFCELVNNSTNLDYFYNDLFKDIKKIQIIDIAGEIDEKFAYKTTLKVLVEIIKYIMRGVYKEVVL